jgi:8-oxo-dGTP diphosphatase
MDKDRETHSMDFGVRVATVVEREGALLLVCHQKPYRDPYWVLPGGRLEPGETIPECAVLYVSEFLRKGRHTIDVVARMSLKGEAEASLGSDPEVEPGNEPTLREVRWVSVEELQEIELLPASIKERLLRDAGGGWTPDRVYLGSTDG